MDCIDSLIDHQGLKMRSSPPAPVKSIPAQPPTEVPSESGYQYYNDNPFEVDCTLNYAILIITPVLVVFGLVMNTFALEAMKSRFLRDLTSQPIIRSLLVLNSALLITGPLYIWITQMFGVFITEQEIDLCLMLRWFNNAIMFSTSWIVVLWIIERVITIGKPEAVWAFWRQTFNRITIMLVIVALVIALSRLLFTKIESEESSAVCLPWLDIDINKSPETLNRHRAFAMIFSLGPCLAFSSLLIGLLLALSLLSHRVHKAYHGISHYHSMLVEIKTTMHLKFVASLVWIGPLFVLTCAPIGLFLFMRPGRSFMMNEWPGIRIDWGGVKVNNNVSFFPHANTTNLPTHRSHWSDADLINNITNNKYIDSKRHLRVAVAPGGRRGKRNAEKVTTRKGRGTKRNYNIIMTHVKTGALSRVKRDKGKPTTLISSNRDDRDKNDDNKSTTIRSGEGGNLTRLSLRDGRSGGLMSYPESNMGTQPPLRNTECMLWFLYYTFAWACVPILLVTEPLFRRECRGKWYALKSSCGCDKSSKRANQSSSGDREQGVDRATTLSDWKKTLTLDPTTNTNLETFVNEGNYFDQVQSSRESSVDVIV